MKLDRNQSGGLGKYRLWDNRKGAWVNDDGINEEHEFFVLMLRDVHAKPALGAYAASAIHVDRELAEEVQELMVRAGVDSKFCKEPD